MVFLSQIMCGTVDMYHHYSLWVCLFEEVTLTNIYKLYLSSMKCRRIVRAHVLAGIFVALIVLRKF